MLFRSGEFATLSIENVSIELLDVDTVSGATPIKFGNPIKVGVYRIINKTGGIVNNLTITDPVTGNVSNLLTELAPDGETLMTFTIDDGEDGEHRLTFSFVDANGVERQFTTLSIEEVTINLLAEDAMTGATPIQFAPLAKP